MGRPEPGKHLPPTLRPHDGVYPLVVILGPTASGKSDLALSTAGRFGGEVINFDAVQVYRGFEIGTAKTPPEQRRGIPHHLIDNAGPAEIFTAGDYARRARAVVAEVRSRGRLPVMAGGTGFYLRAALEGLFSGPQRDENLRRRLSARAEQKPAGHLHRVLARLDPVSAARIHRNDTPKIIRAIEVRLRARSPMSALWEQGRAPLEGFAVIRVGLNPARELLRERIAARSARMFSGGLLEEVRQLLDRGVPREARAFGSLGYRQALEHMQGLLTLEQAMEETARLTRRYAKRQMTWFRREPGVNWFSGFGDDPTIVEQVLELLEEKLTPYRGA